ncbi:hypothetical protein ACC676_08845 [Rhizobium ruizarguesonis]
MLELPTPGSNDGAITVSYRGTSSPQTNRFDFGEFSGFPVIYNHREQIYRKIVQGRSSSTIEVLKQAIHEVGKFFTWVAVKHKISVVTASDIDLNVSSLVYLYLDEIGAQYRPLNFFRRLLRAIGVDEGDIPMNIFLSGHATASDAVPIETVVRMYTHFKGELSIILNRSREFQGLVSIGHDPRRDFGGKVGDWDHPANRLHVLLNSIGTDIKPVQGLRKTVDGAAVAGLQRYPGAMTLRRDGCHKRRYGVTGHLAWLYPSERDLLPFVVLLLVKTRFNVSVITGLELGRYVFRPLALKYGTSERTVQFSARKFKSVNDADQEPSFVHSLCLTKPYAHPYQIIRFLEDLTQPLRDEIKRTIISLKNTKRRSNEQNSYLCKLEKIKNHLFIYFAGGQIGSLGTYAEMGETPRLHTESLRNLKFPTSLSAIRKASMVFAATFSGTTQSVITLLADHKGIWTERHYRNRKQLHERYQALFVNVFELSMALIEADIFSKKNLKLLLSAQNLTPEEVSSLMSDGMLTRWGNRCSAPLDPPPGFDRDTLPGQICAGQACIDGCPRARWFSDAYTKLIQQRDQLRAKVMVLGIAITAASIIHARIARCEALIAAIERNRK